MGILLCKCSRHVINTFYSLPDICDSTECCFASESTISKLGNSEFSVVEE